MVDYIIVDEVKDGNVPLTSFKNIITNYPITDQNAPQEEIAERTLQYTSTGELRNFINTHRNSIESHT